jgi:glucan 1,3-beta-glucosidase
MGKLCVVLLAAIAAVAVVVCEAHKIKEHGEPRDRVPEQLPFEGALAGKIYERNVKYFGAVGDGVTDDSMAIIRALTLGRADDPSDMYPNATYAEHTSYPAYVYFPPGTYLVTQSLPVIYYTEMVGDFADPPTILMVSDSEEDTPVLDAAGFWYPDINQDNFYRHVRNFILDMTQCKKCTGVHWQVSQATSFNNVLFKCGKGSRNRGLFMENGSGGFFSDVIFEGGEFGMWVGNQQFTARNVTIRDASIAGIFLNWDFVWTIKGIHVYDTPVAIDMNNVMGSLTIIDSDFHNITDTVIKTKFVPRAANMSCSVYLENTLLDLEIGTPIIENSGEVVLLASQPGPYVMESWGQGYIWEKNGSVRLGTIEFAQKVKRPRSLVGYDGSYLEMKRPEYYQDDMIDVTSLGVLGDGKKDVTHLLQKILIKYAHKKVLLFPHGVYLLSDTVYVPPGSRLVGRAWSVFNAYGEAFQNPDKPTPMLKVGHKGEVGVAHFTGFMITTRGPQPGAILVEWNMRNPEHDNAACGVWDFHFRIGGGITTAMHPENCPRGTGIDAPASECFGAWALMHVTRTGNLYMENVWGWVADHDIDQKKQINIYNPRGILVESQGPMWLYGTAMEHHGIYQYNFYGAKNIFAGVLQTESAYYQPEVNTPFDPSDHRDPWFCTDDFRCNMSYALQVKKSEHIYFYGTGFYSFYNNWNQSCLHPADNGRPICQMNIVNLEDNHKTYIFSLNTYGSIHMLTSREPYSLAEQSPDWFCSNAVVDLHQFEDEFELQFGDIEQLIEREASS